MTQEPWLCPDCGSQDAAIEDVKLKPISRCGDEKDTRTDIPTYKVLIIGPCRVGKTSLLRSISGKQPPTNYVPTCGLDSVTRSFWVSHKYKVNLQLWDTPGDSRFESIYSLHYRNSQGVLLVVEPGSDKKTIQDIYDKLDRFVPELPEVPVFLVVNKPDASSECIKIEQTATWNSFTRRNCISESHCVNAASGEGVYALFSALASRVAESRHPHLVHTHVSCSSLN